MRVKTRNTGSKESDRKLNEEGFKKKRDNASDITEPNKRVREGTRIHTTHSDTAV